MLAAAFLCCAFALAGILHSQSRFGLWDLIVAHTIPHSADSENEASKYRITCEKIADSVSSSQVYYPASQEFDSGISHWVNPSSQIPACSVETGTPSDVGLILQEIDRARVPFAIKGGGHSANSGLSSTVGIHVSMTRFRDIVVHEDSMTVDIGAGLTWTDVYGYLVPKGLNIVGGRLNGVGVAGLTLGGGFSWKTNQYGLTVDTVTEYELVLPSGEVKNVTEQDEDHWFALNM